MVRGQQALDWSNFPIPEPHVFAVGLGLFLHRVRPWPLLAASLQERNRTQRLSHLLSGTLIGIAIGTMVWSVRAVGRQDIGDPSALVTTGPYAFTRNPMYLSWTVLYLGLTVLVNSMWLLLELPFVLLATDRVVRREERTLEATFGEAFQTYRETVSRYL